MDFSELAKEVSLRSKITVTQKDIERLFGALNKTRLPWELVDLSDFPIPSVFETMKILSEKGLVSISKRGFLLTTKGKEATNGVHPIEDISCSICDGRGINLDRFSQIKKRFLKIQTRRPNAIRKFDQGYVTPMTTLSRFAFSYARGDIAGKEIIILGDDDLMSIVLGLSGLPKRITVVEIDERLTDFILSAAKKEGFQVYVERFDLRRPLPSEHRRRYDAFFTDPPETLKAADAFIGRGISLLRAPGSAGYFGFTRREASLRKWHEVQRMLLKYKIVFTDIIHNFNEYINWGYEEETRAWRLSPVKVRPKKNWYRSALYRFETLPGFRGNYKDYDKENIYEDEESSTT